MIPSSTRASFLRHALSQMGQPYIWAGKGPYILNLTTGDTVDCPKDENGRPLYVFDCSGLVTWAGKMAGARDLTRSYHTGRMRDEFPVVDHPQPGDLALYPGHVEIVICTIKELTMTVSASGGTSKTTTVPLARATNAQVRVKRSHLEHPGFIGFRDLKGLFAA